MPSAGITGLFILLCVNNKMSTLLIHQRRCYVAEIQRLNRNMYDLNHTVILG